MKESKSFGGRGTQLTRDRIFDLLGRLNDSLSQKEIQGDLYLVGGAVLCLAHDARVSTHDLDGIFEPKSKIYECVKSIAREEDLDEDWVNDAVKGFLGERQEFTEFLLLSNLNVKIASPEFLLAMKVQSSRTENSNEVNDIRYLIKLLNLQTVNDVEIIVSKFYDLKLLKPKSWHLVEEILNEEV